MRWHNRLLVRDKNHFVDGGSAILLPVPLPPQSFDLSYFVSDLNPSSTTNDTMPAQKMPKCPVAGLKQASGFRGGGGICPAAGHTAFYDLNVAQAQDLARMVQGKERNLTAIPENSRLEATGLRVEGIHPGGGEDLRPLVRATVATSGSPFTLLPRRKPEWNGLHVNLKDADSLTVRIDTKNPQKGAVWETAAKTSIEPLKAFVVQDQDIVWYPTSVGGGMTIWVELSLVRKTSKLVRAVSMVIKKRQKLGKGKFEVKR